MKLTAVISLKDNYSKIMKEAAKNTSAFRSDVDKTKKAMDKAFKQEQKIKLDAKIARGEITRFEKSMKGLKDKAVKITARTELFFEQHKHVAAAINKLTHAPAVITIKAKDMATSTIKGITSVGSSAIGIGTGVAATGAAAATGLGVAALKGAADLELQKISMEHFIGINNKKMSKDQVTATSDKFLKDLITNANITPFETGEVIKTGTRAVGISGGNTKQAMNFLKLAEDMTALTPGKHLDDAIEALADLKNGEVERMKEFNFKITQAQITAAGGKMENIKNSEGISLGQMYQGGAEKLGQSASGFWSTITGSIKSGITNMGQKSLELLKPELKKWADFFSGPASDKMFNAAAKLMGNVTSSIISGAHKVTDWINTKFLNNVEFQNLPDAKAKFNFAASEIFGEIKGWYDSDGKVMLEKLATDTGTLISDTLKSDTVKKLMSDTGQALGTALVNGFGETIGDHPLLSMFSGAAVGGKVGGVWGAGAGAIVGIGTSGFFSYKNHDKKEKEESDKQMQEFFTPDTVDMLKKAYPDWQPPEFSKKAIGMRTVPYDNYPALLHQGERVLTAQETRQADGNVKSPMVFHLNFEKTDDPEANKVLAILRAALEPVGYNIAPGGAN